MGVFSNVFYGVVWCSLAAYCMIWYDLGWCGVVWYDVELYCVLLCSMVCHGMG